MRDRRQTRDRRAGDNTPVPPRRSQPPSGEHADLSAGSEKKRPAEHPEAEVSELGTERQGGNTGKGDWAWRDAGPRGGTGNSRPVPPPKEDCPPLTRPSQQARGISEKDKMGTCPGPSAGSQRTGGGPLEKRLDRRRERPWNGMGGKAVGELSPGGARPTKEKGTQALLPVRGGAWRVPLPKPLQGEGAGRPPRNWGRSLVGLSLHCSRSGPASA